MTRNDTFAIWWDRVAKDVHQTACEKGFWDHERSDAEAIALCHSELSEALEAIRHDNPPDDKINEFSGAEAELADCVIRIMDLAAARGWDVGLALLHKAHYNKSRSFKHGKNF